MSELNSVKHMNEQEKYDFLVETMGYSLAKRYTQAKIQHWECDRLKHARTETEIYWKNVLSYFR